MQITGTVALVTGANGGIGKAFTGALLERGPGRFLLLVLRTGIQWNALNATGGWHMTFALLPGAGPSRRQRVV